MKVLTSANMIWFILHLRATNINLPGNTCFYAFVILLEYSRECARDRHVRSKGRHPYQWQEQVRYIGEFSLFWFLKRPNNLISIADDSWLICLNRESNLFMEVWCNNVGVRNEKWAMSSDYGTFRSPQAHSSNAHAQPSSGAICLIFGRTLRLPKSSKL